MVVGRRVLLAAAGTSALGLAGCALAPRRPDPVPSPGSPAPDPARDALLSVHRQLTAAYAVEPDAARMALLAWALEVTHEHATALGAALPPIASRTTTPTSQGSPSPGPGGWEPLREALLAAAPVYRARALAMETAQPLVWASMRAWALALASVVEGPVPRSEAGFERLPPPPQTVVEAAQSATTAVEEALYGVQAAGGAPGLAAADLDRVRARVAFWQELRDDLHRAVGPTASPSPTPGPAWFHVPQPADADAAAELVVQLEAAALPILGRSLAFGSDAVRTRLVDALPGIAGALPAWGGPLLRWPGWPTPR